MSNAEASSSHASAYTRKVNYWRTIGMDHSEFLEDCENGNLEEYRIEEYLLRNVLDAQQKTFLHQRNLTIVGVLNGRYTAADEPEVLAWMRSVNERIGSRIFTLVP
jgi:hypothetical protein